MRTVCLRVDTGRSRSNVFDLSGVSGGEITIPDVLYPPAAFIDFLQGDHPVTLARLAVEPGASYPLPQEVLGIRELKICLLTASYGPATQVSDRAFLVLPTSKQDERSCV